jgi:hypothetical protein
MTYKTGLKIRRYPEVYAYIPSPESKLRIDTTLTEYWEKFVEVREIEGVPITKIDDNIEDILGLLYAPPACSISVKDAPFVRVTVLDGWVHFGGNKYRSGSPCIKAYYNFVERMRSTGHASIVLEDLYSVVFSPEAALMLNYYGETLFGFFSF